MSNAIYNYDPVTFEYLPPLSPAEQPVADVSDLDKSLLVPAYATLIEPPATGKHEAAVFSIESGTWSKRQNFRNTALYSTLDGSAVAVWELGDMPEGATALERPSAFHLWNDGSWSLDLETAKNAKNGEINAWRLAANFTSFTHAGKIFSSDPLSRSDIDGMNGYVTLYGTLPPGWPGGWKAVDNSYHAIADVEAWKAFYTSMFAAGNGNFARAQALKATLAAAATPEQVAAIGW